MKRGLGARGLRRAQKLPGRHPVPPAGHEPQAAVTSRLGFSLIPARLPG